MVQLIAKQDAIFGSVNFGFLDPSPLSPFSDTLGFGLCASSEPSTETQQHSPPPPPQGRMGTQVTTFPSSAEKVGA